MSSGTDVVLGCFVALAAVCALALVASRWPRWAKALLVAGVTGLYFAAERALDDTWGWPSRAALPERFVLLAAVIEEPTKGAPGALHVWVNALQDGRPAQQPRAFTLPYTRDLHAVLEEAMKKARQGITQMGSSEPRRGRDTFWNWLRPGSDEQQLKIGDLPVPQLPEK
jgi:hypothetical protein